MEEAKEKKNIFQKIFNKNQLPIILFLVVFMNYLPLFINNIGTKLSKAVTVKQMTIVFAVECILLFIYLIKHIKLTKKFFINVGLLMFTAIAMILVQVPNYISGKLELMDLANIVCITINIAMLYIAFFEVNIEEKHIYKFFIGMVIIGIVACIVNIVIYNQEFLKVLGISGTSEVYNIKSFFAHRNQFATFLYFSIISSVILFLKSNKKVWKIILGIVLALLGANLLITASRTGIACTVLFAGLFFLSTDRIKIKTKVIIAILGLVVLGIILEIVYNAYPEVWDKIVSVIQKVFIRADSIKTFTGRSKFWDIAFEVLFVGPISAIFGIGRFVGIELLHQNYYNVTQFHNFYIEALVAGGIMELLYLLSIYFVTIRKVLKSNIEKTYKILYVCLYLSYAVYCGFESLGRFSIGCVDTACLVFLITVPFLHANTYTSEEKANKIEEKQESKKIRLKRRIQ